MRVMHLTPLCALLLAVPSYANDFSVSGNALLVNDYLWRGMTLSLEDPSIQGSVTLEHDSGAFAGISAESYRYRDDDGDRVNDYELDYYAGYYHDINDDFAIQADVNVYTYGDASHNTEWGLTGFYGDSRASVYYDQDIKSWYGQAEHDYALADDLSLTMHVGYYFDDDGAFGYEDDNFYDLAATVTWAVHEHVNLMAGGTYHEFDHGYALVGVEVTF
ncbi:TorF family putative porin [Shewanella sp. YIC-542]|uniref:TorF family putative porin n=1 Tax=Shewanella mytili TaxID=3377111 RepID=UPI00398F8350